MIYRLDLPPVRRSSMNECAFKEKYLLIILLVICIFYKKLLLKTASGELDLCISCSCCYKMTYFTDEARKVTCL